MAKRVFIVHRWSGSPSVDWYPWLKGQLERKGFNVSVLEMPNTDVPEVKSWTEMLRKAVGKPDTDTFLVGHSVGCITILRYLESLPTEAKVGGTVMVAGFTDDMGFKELSNYFTKPIDWNAIKSHCKRFVAIHSDNDPYVKLKYGDVFKNELGAELIIEHNKGHFGEEQPMLELSSALAAVLKLAKS